MSYIYLLYNKTIKMYYVGVRYAKDCNPDDFWVSYFTSSKIVHKLIDLYGEDDFKYKIVKIFNDRNEAILTEQKYTKKALKKKNYLNAGAGLAVRNDICSLAGKIGGKVQSELGLGFHQYKNNPELHKKWCSMGGLSSGQFQNKNFQSEMGKRGGVKNKGFVWINDGLVSIKYTKKMQNEKNIEEFLNENVQYKIGRLKHKDVMCPHCGKKGQPGAMALHHFKNCKNLIKESSNENS